ncbi:hypothetical protein EMIHUDRAFT_364238 [Emiliania huxleyi CCMP1516]|uniref:Uncharacterized protein n=2 Tax=Emiliania huxleyi TaxID=2903 RepID=A0A0D3KAI8_EMIH1|nr:hypothetical protein EMIHUDRAFT_364238 [Emiliania huxleyi CCMP1516]EOD32773.1 hypothetical protein EMIHUDRAFT_364238 [Emiliania huxleyi CCMP1516]|eukprot:XP_005785202.1 hypothetical protein EMIHUDRAFT_364238 [Emiliania huxleyi CCMP1516]
MPTSNHQRQHNDVPRLAAPLLRPTTCPTPSRGRQEEARATTSGTRGCRACGGTTSRTNRSAQSDASRERPRPPRRHRPRPTVVANQRAAVHRCACFLARRWTSAEKTASLWGPDSAKIARAS